MSTLMKHFGNSRTVRKKDPRISKVPGMDFVYRNITNSSVATQSFVQIHAKNEQEQIYTNRLGIVLTC